jgi:hypothetical protein
VDLFITIVGFLSDATERKTDSCLSVYLDDFVLGKNNDLMSIYLFKIVYILLIGCLKDGITA